jgi:chromosomal replication initiation ATPase DnaA
MQKDHQVFTDARDMAAHYRQVRKNLMKNVIVPKTPEPEPEPMTEVQEPTITEIIASNKGPRIIISEQHMREYEESIAGLRKAKKEGGKKSMRDIAKEVADKHGFTLDDLMIRSRRQKLSIARHEAFYRMRYELNLSYPKIGSFFGMDHTSVMHGVYKHEGKSLKKEKNDG